LGDCKSGRGLIASQPDSEGEPIHSSGRQL
jgi:hypothetical protein